MNTDILKKIYSTCVNISLVKLKIILLQEFDEIEVEQCLNFAIKNKAIVPISQKTDRRIKDYESKLYIRTLYGYYLIIEAKTEKLLHLKKAIFFKRFFEFKSNRTICNEVNKSPERILQYYEKFYLHIENVYESRQKEIASYLFNSPYTIKFTENIFLNVFSKSQSEFNYLYVFKKYFLKDKNNYNLNTLFKSSLLTKGEKKRLVSFMKKNNIVFDEDNDKFVTYSSSFILNKILKENKTISSEEVYLKMKKMSTNSKNRPATLHSLECSLDYRKNVCSRKNDGIFSINHIPLNIFSEINIKKYNNLVISSRILFIKNPEIMQKYNIENYHDLHNILKKLHAKHPQDIPCKLSFTRTPTIIVDSGDIKKQLQTIYLSNPNLSQRDICRKMDESFGIDYRSLNSSPAFRDFYKNIRFSTL